MCPTLCDPMDCSTPGLHVHHQLTEINQTHVHWVGDAIQPSRLLLFPFPPAFNLSQHQFSSVQLSCSVMSNSLQPYGLQHARLLYPSLTPKACSNSSPLGQWCHPTISSSVTHFFSCPQSFPSSESFPMSQFFTSGGQSIGASASVLPMNIQDWFPLGWTGLISLQSEGLSRVFSSTQFEVIRAALMSLR